MSIYDGRKPEPPYPTWKDLEDEITSLKSQLEQEKARHEAQFFIQRDLNEKREAALLSQLEQAQGVSNELRDHLGWVLPMAKGYAAVNDFGSNRIIIANATAALERSKS
jgi:hypothetical protein